MRVLRFLLLAMVVLAVYFAQYLLDLRTLSQVFPPWLLARFPGLARYLYILPDDLVNSAIWLAILTALAFGLMSLPWPGERLPSSPLSNRARAPLARRLGLPLAGALLLAGAVWLHIRGGGQESLFDRIAWLLSIALVLFGAARVDSSRSRAPADMTERSQVRVQRMALVLVAGGLLFGWQLFALPVRIADAVAGIGLVAHEMVSGNGSGLFAPNGIGLPGLSHLVTAIFIRLYGDAFAGTRLAGWFAGMALLVATWALSRELLRRTRVSDARGNVLEDDGGWPAIFAVAVLAAGYSMIHFARLPLFLESVVWGTLALWALLRGLRRSSLLLLTLSGLFTGLAMILTPVGMVYLAGVPLTWFGVIVLQPRLVERRLGGVGVAGPLLWIGALLVIMAPILGYWSRQAGYFGDYLQAVDALGVNPAALPVAGLWANLKRTILTFNLTADASLLFGYPGHLLDSALAPLFVLGVGALLFNLDRLLGWVGIFMLATGLMVGAVMAPATPYWPLLLPLLPFSALAIAFAVDRLWALLLDVAGVQFQQIFVVVIFGLLLWAVGNNWLDYYQFAALDGNPASHTAHAVRATALERTVGLVIVEGANAVSWADPPLALVAVERAPESQLELLYGAWPGALPAGSRLLVQPADRWLLTDLAQAYPGGVASVERDMRANPVIYMYDLP